MNDIHLKIRISKPHPFKKTYIFGLDLEATERQFNKLFARELGVENVLCFWEDEESLDLQWEIFDNFTDSQKVVTDFTVNVAYNRVLDARDYLVFV